MVNAFKHAVTSRCITERMDTVSKVFHTDDAAISPEVWLLKLNMEQMNKTPQKHLVMM